MNDLSVIEGEEAPGWRLWVERAFPFLFAVPLMAALGALLYLTSAAGSERALALAQQQHSYEIIALARRLDGSIAKAEATLARYVISMEADTGRLYDEQWNRASAQLSALERETRDNAEQQRRLAALRQAFRDRREMLNDIALRTNYDQKITSLGKFHQAGKAENLTRIGALLDAVIEGEMALLSERNLDVIRTGNRSAKLAASYGVVGLVLLVGLLFIAWVARTAMSERRAQWRLAEDEAARAQRLEEAVAVRTAELELAYAQLKQEGAERAAAEESLRQMQKMEAVGQLTGGIAHDFNNMLAVVVGGLELARRKLAPDQDDAIRQIDNAMEGANRASALTRRLLSFARSEPHLPAAWAPDDLVRGMAELIDRTIGDQIRVVYDLDAADWMIHVDRQALENAILNLAVNARDAMDGRGRLTLATRRQRLVSGEVNECLAGEYLCLSVADTGCGMSREVMERAFEPFFTTKPVGKGTGLGLSQIFGFVGQSGGEIRILSEEGRGTQVEIFLPRHQRVGLGPLPVESPDARAPERADEATEGVTLLLVEDDPRVLAQTRSALIELGHSPICCDSPRRAAEMLEANPAIRLILSDVLMPDMTGPEMVASLPERFRAIPVIFVTGYAGDVADNRLFEGHGLLRKPYTLAALAAAIGQALAGAATLSARRGSPADAAAE